MLIALDLSTTQTGLCRGYLGDKESARCQSFTADKRWPVEKRMAFMVDHVMKEVDRAQGLGPVTVVAEAAMSTRGAKITRMLAQLHGAIMYELYGRNLVLHPLHQSKVKVQCGVKGNCTKEILREAITLMGIRTANLDESDAAAVFVAAEFLLKLRS